MFAQATPQGPSPVLTVIIIATSLLFWAAIIWGLIALFRYIRKRERRSGGGKDIPLGTAGLILVSMRLLQFAWLGARDIGTFLWFVGMLGIFASHVGLVISIVGMFKDSGRTAGIFGVLTWGLFTILFLAMR